MAALQLKETNILAFQKDLAKLPSRKLLINTINAHSYNTAQKDPAFAEALLKGDVLIPDGASIVKAVKFLRGETIERTAGWDLFVFEMNRLNTSDTLQPGKKAKVFFLGSSDNVLDKIKEKTGVDYPNLEIYSYSPPYKAEFTVAENREMIDVVNAVEPDLLWIGMTAPKQEKWAFTHFKELKVNGHIGTVGAVFDFYAGTVERAPLWWQNNSLEWLYRLIKEPRRMWRRYIVGNTLFVLHILREKIEKPK